MTEPDPTPDAEPTPEVDKPQEPFDETRALEKIRKANSEAENLRKRLKELEPLASKAKELEDSQKSEQQRMAERVAELERSSTDATSEAMRLRVALAQAPEGAKPEQILRASKRLVGSTEEELAADAADYFADFSGGKSSTSRKPNERLRGGSDPDEKPEETDPRKLAAAIAPQRL